MVARLAELSDIPVPSALADLKKIRKEDLQVLLKSLI